MIATEQLTEKFKQRFGDVADLIVVFAPGRANLIGEHTDYNEGFVMPVALDCGITIAGRRVEGKRAIFHSVQFDEDWSFDVGKKPGPDCPRWALYIAGMAFVLARAGNGVCAVEAVVSGDVPLGSGLSSSAALEIATGTLFEALCGYRLDGMEMALLGQKAENEIARVPCGIMDQFASRCGRNGNAMILDCRSLDYSYVDINTDDIMLILCHSGVHRELAAGEYAKRREQCSQAVKGIKAKFGSVQSLRDVNMDMFMEVEKDLDRVTAMRARHVVSENQRVHEFARAMASRDLVAMGKILYQSHESLRDLYEVSCEELDFLVEQSRNVEGLYGARMTGAGFGGCTLNILAPGSGQNFKNRVAAAYRERFGIEPEVFMYSIAGGARFLEPPR